jgi:hypothetical protein
VLSSALAHLIARDEFRPSLWGRRFNWLVSPPTAEGGTGEALAGLLRPGNATTNATTNAADLITTCRNCAQLPQNP